MAQFEFSHTRGAQPRKVAFILGVGSQFSARERASDCSLDSMKLKAICAAFALLFCPLALAREYRSKQVLADFQRAHPCHSTGLSYGACPGYIRDHIIPLACNGPDAVENLQWQTIPDAKAKDKWERKPCRLGARQR